MTPTWPDIAIGLAVFVFALRGWKRGFVRELAGVVGIVAALVAAFRYPGTLDAPLGRLLHIGAGQAHIAGTIAFSVAAYVAVMALAFLFERFARLPVVSFGNAAVGALVGAAKALVVIWAIIYIATFFPLPPGVRADLRHSTAVALVTGPDRSVDAVMRTTLPPFVRPYADPLFRNHRV